MKKLLSVLFGMALVMVSAGHVFAVKPEANLAAAQKVDWNLSGAVMPVPPYGLSDITGSDTSSKLIVNQPNGNTELTVTGVMGGLTPNTGYTVYLSNGYTPALATGWNVTGLYTVSLTVDSVTYTEYLSLTQSGDSITGTFLALDSAGTSSRWNIDSGTISGNAVTINAHYGSNTAQKLVMTGTIASDSTMSGEWRDVDWNTRSGDWSTTSGAAAKTYSGSTGWPGLFNTIQPFTFMTDEFGVGSWHINLKDADFASTGIITLSVWINGGGGTILISDPFQVVR